MNNTNELLEQLITLLGKTNKAVSCPAEPIEIPGSNSSGAYTAGDCMGTLVKLAVPTSGIIYSATFFDLDDESSQVDLEIFRHEIAQIASEAAWAPSDEDMLKFVTELAFAVGDDHTNSYTFDLTNIGKAYSAPEGFFWIQAVTRSTPTIAIGAKPRFQLQIIPGDPNWQER